MQKRLLCIAPDDPANPMFTCRAMHDWKIRHVSGLGEASRALRDDHFFVGLLVRLRSLQRSGGLDSFLQVLDSERNLFQGQLALERLRLLELQSIVRLYSVLGGGWQ